MKYIPQNLPIRFLLILGASFLVWVATCAADVSETRTALQQLSSKVKMTTLSNGLRVILYRRGVAPVFSGTVSVRVGGTDEAEGATGISHMFEHMAFKGTRTLGTKDYPKEKKLLEELEVYEGKRSRGEVLS